MSEVPSKPFSSGTEYEVFKYNYCEICRHHKVREDGFPALVEDGGCPIEDAMEFARFDNSQFPTDMVRELRDCKDNVIDWHYCLRFNSNSGKEETQNNYFNKMKRALEQLKEQTNE